MLSVVLIGLFNGIGFFIYIEKLNIKKFAFYWDNTYLCGRKRMDNYGREQECHGGFLVRGAWGLLLG